MGNYSVIPRKMTVLLCLVLFALLAVVLRGHDSRLQAQAVAPTNDLPPHKIAETPDGTKLYEMMQQGCQIFIAERLENNTNHSPAAISITTGRDCK
jgi:hypothetical protein